MKLLPGEEVLVTSNDKIITLTNYRIEKSEKTWGEFYNAEIFLENISSVEVKHFSNQLYILLAALLIIAGVVPLALTTKDEIPLPTIAAGIIALLCIALWLMSRKYVISVSSNGGAKLNIQIKGMGKVYVEQFMDKIAQAKLQRTNQLSNR